MSHDPELDVRSLDFGLVDGQMVYGVISDTGFGDMALLQGKSPDQVRDLAVRLADVVRREEGDDRDIDLLIARRALDFTIGLDESGPEAFKID